jgi:hypothetical protein
MEVASKIIAGIVGLIIGIPSTMALIASLSGESEDKQSDKKNGCLWVVLIIISIVLMGYSGMFSFGGSGDPIPMRRP